MLTPWVPNVVWSKPHGFEAADSSEAGRFLGEREIVDEGFFGKEE